MGIKVRNHLQFLDSAHTKYHIQVRFFPSIFLCISCMSSFPLLSNGCSSEFLANCLELHFCHNNNSPSIFLFISYTLKNVTLMCFSLPLVASRKTGFKMIAAIQKNILKIPLIAFNLNYSILKSFQIILFRCV